MKILIAGSNGFVGRNLFNSFKKKYETYGVSRTKTENTSHVADAGKPEIFDVLETLNPDVVIHAIKIPFSIDYYELNKEEAEKQEMAIIKNLAGWCIKNNKKFIFISSDYVYAGETNGYDEDSKTNPVNFYGKIKLEMEKVAEKVNNHTILRPTVIFGMNDEKNFLGQMIKTNANMKVPEDQISNPTDVNLLVKYVEGVIDKDVRGTFVATGIETASRYEFAKKIKSIFGLTGKIIPVKTSDLKQDAKRPLNCGSISYKLRDLLEINAKCLDDSLRAMKESESEKIKKEIMKLTEKYYEFKFANPIFEAGKTTVHNSGKMFNSEELKAGIEAVLDGWWTEGKFSNEFAQKLAEYTGIPYFILTNSGSSANLLAIYALTAKELGDRRLKKGDEIISIAAAFPTTVAPIIQAGCVPVFVDIELGSYNIDCKELEKALSKKTKAIFIAHTLGNPFNIKEVIKFAKKNNLWLIEDCCDALGSKYDGKMIGNFGDIATFSFYPAHHITTGEGGAVATKDLVLRKAINSFRNWGRDCWCEPGKDNSCKKRFSMQFGKLPFGYDHKNTYTKLGFNLKSTDLQSAIGLAQIKKIKDFENKRKENFKFLHEKLKRYENKIILPVSLKEAEPAWFGFLITVRENAGFKRQELIDFLQKNKIELRALFAGNITKHPCLEGENYRVVGELKNTDITMNNTFWVGVQPNITKEKREHMAKVFDEFFKSH